MKVRSLIKEKSQKSRDPYVLFFNDLYYYCFSRDDKIYLSVSEKLESLEKAKEIVVYRNDEGLKNLWAPELHILNNKCYIYVACDDGNNENHRMYVLYNDSNNPLEEYKNNGIITDTSNKWAIDGTILEYKNSFYFIWSGCDKNIHYKQEIFIAKMANPFELCSKKILVSTPEYDWEKCGGDGMNLAFVNEGPSVFKTDKDVYIIYSASGCWCNDYCLGALKLIGDDPLSIKSWKKYKKPIFSSSEKIIGPGHCSFTVERNKDEKLMVFHSFDDKNDLSLTNVSAKYIKITIKDDEFYFDS